MRQVARGAVQFLRLGGRVCGARRAAAGPHAAQGRDAAATAAGGAVSSDAAQEAAAQLRRPPGTLCEGAQQEGRRA